MERSRPEPSSVLALVVLVLTAIVAPWPFGSVGPGAILVVTTTTLLAAAAALVLGAVRGGPERPDVPLWPLLAFVLLGLLQLVPIPSILHALVAPGSHAVWHPDEATAAAVLGGGPFPVSVDPDSTLRSVALVCGLALLAFLAAPALTRPRTATAAVAALAAGGFLLSAYAIFARTRFGALLYGRFEVPTVAPFGPFVSKNHFAGYVVMAALLAAGLAVGLADDARRRGRDWTAGPRAGGVVLAAVAALTMALAALASLSRGGTIALAAGATCFVVLLFVGARGRAGRGGWIPSLALAGAVGVVLVTLVPPEAHTRMRSLGGASFRFDTWRDGLRLAFSSPIVGSGLGAFHDAYPRFKDGHGLLRVEHAENDYVEVFAEAGVIGLGIVLLGAGLLLAGAARGVASRADPLVRGVGLGALGGLVALGVHSVVDFNLRIPSNAALAAVLAAAAAGASGVRRRPLAPAWALVLALGVLILLGAVATRPLEPWLPVLEEARLANAAATPEARELRLRRAEGGVRRLLRRRPAHAESWLILAGIRAAAGEAAAGSALARHAVALDPERPALREAAAPLLREAD